MRKVFLCLLPALFQLNFSNAQSFYDVNTIQDIRIYFGFSNWDYRMDTATAGADTYTIADSVLINGTKFINVGVKYKGNSSYNANRAKNPLHIKLDKVLKQDYQGYDDIKLSNGWSDPSMQREVLSYHIARRYMDAAKANWAKVYINGSYYGIMTNCQSYDGHFLDESYYSSKYAQFKCNPLTVGGTGSNLDYLGTTVGSYTSKYEQQSSGSTDWTQLINLCDTLKNNVAAIEKVLDVDRALWMLAFNDVLVNLDSYSGNFRQNYYLYRDHQNKWNTAVWDLNMSFGSFTQAGGTVGNLQLSGMQNMSPIIHKSETGWPLIYKLLNVPMYERMYIAHMRTINNENFANADYKIYANAWKAMIDNAVQTDPNYLSTYTNFQNSLTNTSTGGMGQPQVGIYTLMDQRAIYLNGTSQFTAATPTISAISASVPTPAYGSTVTITANVVNRNAVYLGYRYFKPDHFVRVQMFDDGLHNDGAAGDNVYGADVPVNSLEIQYYIYAENANAGMFSPERAEHEFYTINATIPMASPSDLAINEYAVNNISGISNEEGKYKDWVEIYNKNPNALGLANIYLSDSLTLLNKWKFPANAFITGNGYLLVWADDKDSMMLEHHTNFNLNAAGDRIIISDGSSVIGDSVSFGPQIVDEDWSRCPDGTGVFVNPLAITPRASNSCAPTGINEVLLSNGMVIAPNPGSGLVKLFYSDGIDSYEVMNAEGQILLSDSHISSDNTEIDLSAFSNGLYLVRVNKGKTLRLIVQH